MHTIGAICGDIIGSRLDMKDIIENLIKCEIVNDVKNIKDKMFGCLYGQAIGDALGL